MGKACKRESYIVEENPQITVVSPFYFKSSSYFYAVMNFGSFFKRSISRIPLSLRIIGLSTKNFDFVAMFHGVGERVPTASLEFGARVLDRFLDQA